MHEELPELIERIRQAAADAESIVSFCDEVMDHLNKAADLLAEIYKESIQ